jgi:hypothetical protein
MITTRTVPVLLPARHRRVAHSSATPERDFAVPCHAAERIKDEVFATVLFRTGLVEGWLRLATSGRLLKPSSCIPPLGRRAHVEVLTGFGAAAHAA